MSFRTIGEYGFPCPFPVTDLRGGGASTYGPKFSQFHAVFRKIWQNHMLTSPGGLASPLRGILDSSTKNTNIGKIRYICLNVTLFHHLTHVRVEEQVPSFTLVPHVIIS